MYSVRRKTVAVYCESLFAFNVFKRIGTGFSARGWSLVVVTHLLSVWWLARRAGLPCTLVKRARGVSQSLGFEPNRSTETALALISQQRARLFYESVWDTLAEVFEATPFNAVMLWNGQRLSGHAAAAFARAHKLAILFLELGNIEPKLFADPQGVNAASHLARHPEVLDAMTPSEESIDRWRERFLERRQKAATVPQAGALAQINVWYALDWIGANLLRIPQPRDAKMLAKAGTKLRHLTKFHISDVPPTGRYIFLPLQVSNDTNLLFYSKYDNLSAIEFAATRAQEKDLILVIKPHPAEPDIGLLQEISEISARRGFVLSNHNTIALIMGADEVITINSSVGLEAILLGKPVISLGRRLYERFDRKQAAAYVMEYLLDFAPFGTEPAKLEVADKLIAMLEQQNRA